MNALGYRLATSGIGRTVEMKLLSSDAQRVVDIKLEPAPEDPPRDERVIRGRSPFTGMTVINLSPRVAMELSLPSTSRGVYIKDINRRSPAARFGFRTGDIVEIINGETISTTERLEIVARIAPGAWRFVINRRGRRIEQEIR